MAKQFDNVSVSKKPSYSPERTLLNKEFDQEYMTPGTVISFEDIVAVAHLGNPTDAQLRPVLTSWRDELKRKNIFTRISFRDRCLWVMTDEEMAGKVNTNIGSIYRKATETTQIILVIDPKKLTEPRRKQLELDKRIADGIQLAQSKKQITAPI